MNDRPRQSGELPFSVIANSLNEALKLSPEAAKRTIIIGNEGRAFPDSITSSNIKCSGGVPIPMKDVVAETKPAETASETKPYNAGDGKKEDAVKEGDLPQALQEDFDKLVGLTKEYAQKGINFIALHKLAKQGAYQDSSKLEVEVKLDGDAHALVNQEEAIRNLRGLFATRISKEFPDQYQDLLKLTKISLRNCEEERKG